MANGKKTRTATVIVPPREGFNGVYAAGRHWPAAQHEGVELTDEEIANLARRPGVVVLIGGKVAQVDPNATSTTAVQVTPDEQLALEEFRRNRDRMLQAQTASGPGYKLEKADRDEAVQQAIAQTSASPALAQAPLQNREVLHGMTPDAPAGTAPPVESNPKPLDVSGNVVKDQKKR